MNEKEIKKTNKRQVHKMRKYIQTFPLKLEEICQIQRDIEGMAEEADARGERLENVLGKTPKSFCDELIYAIGGIKTPGGRKILRFVGVWYEILGFWQIFNGILGLCMGGTMWFTDLFEPAENANFLLNNGLESVYVFAVGFLFYLAGKAALRCSTDIFKSKQAMKWGIGMLAFEILRSVILNFPIPLTLSSFAVYLFIAVVGCFVPVLYIIGARRNRPCNTEA